MPRSRGRRPKQNRSRSQHQRRRRLSQQPDLRMLPVMQAVDEAETRGDAAGALELVETYPTGSDGAFFWNPHRVARLAQVAQLGPLLPGWATSRWILEQSLIQFDPALRGARHEAMRVAIDLRGGYGELSGVDVVDAQTKVMDHDWVHRQLLIYEYGGLERFLHAWATPDLVAGADRIREWVTAPLRALRLESREPGVLTWTDLATGDELETPNLGAAVLEQQGDCALARVVPTEGGPMLDGVPLGVAEKTAEQVASEPGAWLDALRAVAGTSDYFADLVHGNFLVTDVPSNISGLALRDFLPSPIPRDVDGTEGAEAVMSLARHTTTNGGAEPRPFDLWPCVAAELLAPDVLPHLASRLGPADHAWLEVLGEALPAPAGAACQALMAGRRRRLSCATRYVGQVKTVSHRDLRNRSGEVLRAVEAGESFTITKGGVAVARLVPVSGPTLDVRRVRPVRRRGGFSELQRVAVDETVQHALDALRDERS